MKQVSYSDDGLVYLPNGQDDYDIDTDYIPHSYLDSKGIRHAYIWDESDAWEARYKLDPETNRVILDVSIF